MQTLHWLDLETTGLDPTQDHILEIAVVTTDERLIEQERFHRCIHAGPIMLARMNDFVRDMHTHSGLLGDVQASTVDPMTALRDLETYLDGYEAKQAHFAGSGIAFDLNFLRAHAPYVLERAHYRALDVTSLRLAYEQANQLGNTKYVPAHRAMKDVEDTIAEYKTFRVTKEQQCVIGS